MFSRRAASEFPNDNPELHDGLVWQSDSVTGHALPTLRLRQLTGRLPKVIGPEWVERAKRVATAPRLEVPVIGRAPVIALPSNVSTTQRAETAPNLEVTPRAETASSVEATPAGEPSEVLGQEPVVDAAVPECVIEDEPSTEPEALATPAEPPTAVSTTAPTAFDALVAALVRVALDRGTTRVAAELPASLASGRLPAGAPDSPRARALVALGPAWRSALDGGDLAGCGDQPLDVWASELLATLLTAPGERETLRRALRRHGVAAFGMLIAA